jgi:hypothetical protein
LVVFWAPRIDFRNEGLRVCCMWRSPLGLPRLRLGA